MSRSFPALGFDPAPGELGAVDRLQARLSSVSRTLSETRTTLQGVTRSGGGWEGQAAEAFQGTVGELPPYLDTAASSMESAANALRSWHADLAAMQRTADQLEAEAAEAKRALEQAQSNPDLPALGELDPTFAGNPAAQRARAELLQAEQEYEEIKERAERLKDEHEDIAKRTAEKIKAAKEEAPDEPGILDRAGDILGDVFGAPLRLADQLIRDNANAIAGYGNYLASASGLLGTVGLVFPPAGAAGTLVGIPATLAHGVAYYGGAQGVDEQTLQNDVRGLILGGLGARAPQPVGEGFGLFETTLGAQGLSESIQEYWFPQNGAQTAALFLIPGGGGFAAVPAYNYISEGHEIDEKIASAEGQ